jgi:hypothetical protein
VDRSQSRSPAGAPGRFQTVLQGPSMSVSGRPEFRGSTVLEEGRHRAELISSRAWALAGAPRPARGSWRRRRRSDGRPGRRKSA